MFTEQTKKKKANTQDPQILQIYRHITMRSDPEGKGPHQESKTKND